VIIQRLYEYELSTMGGSNMCWSVSYLKVDSTGARWTSDVKEATQIEREWDIYYLLVPMTDYMDNPLPTTFNYIETTRTLII
jgi:hypothetical protein